MNLCARPMPQSWKRWCAPLREPYGRAAAMYLLDGLPVAAIAQKLGRPAPTVQNQLFRAKAILRKQIMERRQE